MIDMWMVAYNRCQMTEKAITFLASRTKTPYRLFVIDNHSDDDTPRVLDRLKGEGKIFSYIRTDRNYGIHMAHNLGLSFMESEICVGTDNDIYVPLLKPDWLDQMVELMKRFPGYAAIACQPHAWLGNGELPQDPSGVIERAHCGAVMRTMRTEAVRQVGGWERRYDANRNHEETYICRKLREANYKIGYASFIRCYHDWGNDNNWGYKDIDPHKHGHRIPGTEIYPTPEMMKSLDPQINPINWQSQEISMKLPEEN